MAHMKKILSIVLCALLAISLASCSDGSENAEETEQWTLSGRYCEDTSGTSFLLSEKEGAICITPADTEELFDDLENGDEIEISVDSVAETYPAQATVYSYTLIEKGTVEDLDVEEIQDLEVLGWEFSFEVEIIDESSEAAAIDVCPAIMVNGEIYFDTDHKSTVTGRCGNMDGQITSECSSFETPSINEQSNFGTGYGYQYGGREGTVEVLLDDGEWYVFATEDVKANWNVFEDVIGKTFIYEGEGLQGDDFTITFDEYTFSYSEGIASSHLGFGTWSIDGNIITLAESDPEMKNNFEIGDEQLIWLEKDSDNFTYIKLTDGEAFLLGK
jgi:hypothetical protein